MGWIVTSSAAVGTTALLALSGGAAHLHAQASGVMRATATVVDLSASAGSVERVQRALQEFVDPKRDDRAEAGTERSEQIDVDSIPPRTAPRGTGPSPRIRVTITYLR
jgi:hypothetical protein